MCACSRVPADRGPERTGRLVKVCPRGAELDVDGWPKRLTSNWPAFLPRLIRLHELLGMMETGDAREPVRAVLFDFNGTLSDDEPSVFEAYRSLCKSHLGWTLTRHFYGEHLVGRSDDEMIAVMLSSVGAREFSPAQLLDERHRQYVRQILRCSPISSSTAVLVHRLRQRGVLVGIVSGTERRDIDLVLDHSSLQDAFDVVVSQEDVFQHKPDLEGYRLAMSLLGVEPQQAVVFEDSLVGIQAAKAAGALCIAVEGTHAREVLVEAADLVVPKIGPEVMRLIGCAPDALPWSEINQRP